MKYTTQHFQLLSKNILLWATSATTFHLNSIATIVHIGFWILTQKYLSILHEPNNIIEHLKEKHVIINEMSMMTCNKLCVIEQWLKQSMHLKNIFPFETKTHITCWRTCPTTSNLWTSYYKKWHIMQKLSH
jgi:hypothetical protein